ncbi:Small CPxCG-related zinc finger protein [Vreelandella rituensis]|uniref:Uncharacterized protein n=1 Tax=Vreelandella rituensis TaxID=2282306 RepID=A0A368U8Z9_9GAMM|nr:hypothetical protein DU506_00545 [Halomonas rituensis]
MENFLPVLPVQDLLPTCPSCGYEALHIDEDSVTDKSHEEITCRDCNATYTVTVHVAVTYSTHEPAESMNT